MKNISLIKVTLAVFITTLASTYVSAENNTQDIAPSITSLPSEQISFAALDTDKDGLLSISETKGNELLHNDFANVDINGDASISQDELSTYINKIK